MKVRNFSWCQSKKKSMKNHTQQHSQKLCWCESPAHCTLFALFAFVCALLFVHFHLLHSRCSCCVVMCCCGQLDVSCLHNFFLFLMCLLLCFALCSIDVCFCQQSQVKESVCRNEARQEKVDWGPKSREDKKSPKCSVPVLLSSDDGCGVFVHLVVVVAPTLSQANISFIVHQSITNHTFHCSICCLLFGVSSKHVSCVSLFGV